ncbi:altered inheritance of mitochondria protein 21, partial [Flavobacterium sp. SaA2.13]|nr:altered inheritance of mitochondria protein 21 [Flavobacterium sp. SaA2.13]
PARPEVAKQRFPSRDIWEDAPESHTLVTTIEPSEEEVKSPEVPSKPSIPLRPQKRPQQAPAVDASTKPVTSPTEKRQ